MDLIAELESRKSYLKVSELARLLSFSPSQVYALIAQDRLPALRVGPSIRLCPRETAKWMRERTV